MPSTGEKKRKVIETSIGRLIFNDAIPQNLGFVKRETDDDEFKLEINQVADKKLLGKIIHNCYRVNGVTECSAMAGSHQSAGLQIFHYRRGHRCGVRRCGSEGKAAAAARGGGRDQGDPGRV